MREPEGRESGIMRRAHLCDHFRDALREVEALRELRVDEQTDFHDGFCSACRLQATVMY